MDKPKIDKESDSERLSECLGREGKWWWRKSLELKVISFLVGTVTLLIPSFPQGWMPFILLAVAALAEVFNYLADRIFGMSHSFRAKLDLQNSLGWAISPGEYADFLADLPDPVKATAKMPPSASERKGSYFISQLPQGPQRALENVEESAWWSKILARKMFRFCMAILIMAVTASLLSLIATTYAISITGSSANNAGLSGMARVATSALMLLLSLGTIKLTVGYHSFHNKAEKVEKHAERLLMSGDTDVMDAVKTFHEYHLARVVAPPMPDWIWRRNEKELNVLFAQRRESRYSPPEK